jgi:hypothetical protein
LAGVSWAQNQEAEKDPADAADVKPAVVPDPEDIIKELEKDRPAAPLVLPKEPRDSRRTVERPRASVTPSQQDRQRLPEGYILVDRVGRLNKEGQWWTFGFQSDQNRTVREPPIRLLPCRMLESMELAASGGTRAVDFKISGQVTEFHGLNYLLLEKVLVVRGHGNLE